MIRRAMFLAVVAIVLEVCVSTAQETKYGSDLTVQTVTPIASLIKNPDQYAKKKVLIEGEITEVCQSMGCWIKISDGSSPEPILFKVEDGVIEFPKSGKGRKVKAEGIFSFKMYSKEQLVSQARHEAEEQGKPFDSSGITGPKVVVRIDGEGAVVRE